MPGGPLAELAREPSAYRWLRTAGWGFARVFSLVALAVAWELAARSGAFTPYMLPALSAVLERIWSDLIAGDLVVNTGETLYRAFTGFLIGAVAGIALGMGISAIGSPTGSSIRSFRSASRCRRSPFYRWSCCGSASMTCPSSR